jgi:two-component system cell cycle response regulator
MLTAEAGRENVLRIARMGVRDYLVKPFKEDQIVERVSRIVELKNRGGVTAKSKKRFDDPLKIVLVDDKTAIWDQFKAGVSDTPWQIDGLAQAQAALESIGQKVPDLIIVSTSLPDGAGFWLFQKLRSSVKTEKLPIFALSVKTALDDQARAQQVGFTGIITKPIDFTDLKLKISRTLGLDASYKYYEQKSGVLVVNYPAGYNQSIANDMAAHLQEKVTEAVDAGLDKLVVDLTQLKNVDMPLIEQVLNVMKYASELSLKSGVIGSDEIRQACTNFEETKEWLLASSLDDILKLM